MHSNLENNIWRPFACCLYPPCSSHNGKIKWKCIMGKGLSLSQSRMLEFAAVLQAVSNPRKAPPPQAIYILSVYLRWDFARVRFDALAWALRVTAEAHPPRLCRELIISHASLASDRTVGVTFTQAESCHTPELLSCLLLLV